jgi:hypothetical protein
MTQDWRHRAACRNLDPEIFFPVAEAGPARERAEVRALAVCARCPVVAECLAYALDALPYGIAGGMTEDERRALRRPPVPTAPTGGGDPAPRRRPDSRPLMGRSHKGARVRAQGIARLIEGASPRQVAHETGVDERTAQRWAARPEVRAIVPRTVPPQMRPDPLSRRSLACAGRTRS